MQPVVMGAGGGGLEYEALATGSFAANRITKIEVPAGCTTLAYEAFNGWTALEEVILPASLTTLGGRDFRLTALLTVTIPSGVTAIPASCFYSCSRLNNPILPAGITTIGDYAFGGIVTLTTISLPSALTTIGGSAFASCGNLASIDLPAGVTSIGASAFSGTSSLTMFICRATTPPTLTSTSITGLPATCAIKVPAASVAAYQSASYWSDRAAYISAI